VTKTPVEATGAEQVAKMYRRQASAQNHKAKDVEEDFWAVVRTLSGVRRFVNTNVRKEAGGRGKAGHINDEEGIRG
jgi:hypothetical protein